MTSSSDGALKLYTDKGASTVYRRTVINCIGWQQPVAACTVAAVHFDQQFHPAMKQQEPLAADQCDRLPTHLLPAASFPE